MTSQYYWSCIYFILFLLFFQTQLLAYNLEKCLHLVLIPRSITRQLTHGCRCPDFGILNCITMVAKSKSMFSLLLQVNIPNNRDNLPQIQHFLSPNEGIPQIFTIFGTFPIYLTSFLVESKPNPNIRDWTPTLQQISQIIQGIHFSYRHLLNWQYWDRYWTILLMLLWQFSTAASKMDSQYPFFFWSKYCNTQGSL